jgi:hypothetical protein
MPLARLITAIIVYLAVAGCFQSTEEFIPAAEAEFPFESITYRTADDDQSYSLIREGDHYRPESEDTTVRLRKIADDTWLVQTAFVDDGKTLYLYGVAVLDAGGKAFRVYKAIAEAGDRTSAVLARYGLAACDNEPDNICLSTADTYIAYVKDRIAAGDAPSTTFEILERK